MVRQPGASSLTSLAIRTVIRNARSTVHCLFSNSPEALSIDKYGTDVAGKYQKMAELSRKQVEYGKEQGLWEGGQSLGWYQPTSGGVQAGKAGKRVP